MPGDGARFQPNMPVTLAPPNVQPNHDNSEIAYVTGKSGEVLTLDRAQEGTTAMQVAGGWVVIGSLTAKTIKDLEDAIVANAAAILAHTSRTDNPHAVTKTQVGLGNVDNTSDTNKPVASATQTALNTKVDKITGKGLSTEDYTTTEKTKLAGIAPGATQNASDAALRDRTTHTGSQAISTVTGLQTALDGKATPTDISTAINNVVNAAPGTLDTLDELAAALGDDPNFATTITSSIAAKADASVLTAHTSNTSNPHSVTKAQVGLGNADNTSDATKNSATATLTNKTISGGSNTLSNIPESAVTGLVGDLAAKAPLASPALTGTPTAPTATAGTSTTQVATTAFVGGAVATAATPDATSSTKGKVQLTGDLGGSAGTPKVKARTAITVGPAGSVADYVVDGTADDVELQAAINALSDYGKLYVLPGTYLLNANLLVTRSNVEIELSPGTILRAAQRTDSSFKSEYRGIIHIQQTTSGGSQQNVYLHGGTIDCNTQAETSAVAVWGASGGLGSYNTKEITIADMAFVNKANSTSSPALVQLHSQTDLNLGRLRDIAVRNCVFDTTDRNALYIRGSFFDGVRIDDNEFKNVQIWTINMTSGSESFNVVRSNKNIYIRRNHFHDTMLSSQSYTVFDFGMSSRHGCNGLIIEGNTFNSQNEYNPNDNPNLQIYASLGVIIRGNIFKNTRQALSLGYSNNATTFYDDPNQAIIISDNTFINVHSTLTDMDSNTRSIWDGNVFYECGAGAFNAYAIHSYTMIQNNLFYNMQSEVESAAHYTNYEPGFDTTTYPDQYRSAFSLGGQMQMVVQNNMFVDDRKLNNPASTNSSDATTVAGGSQAARTYYFRYVYANASGQTLASPSQSVSVAANNLLKVRPTNEGGTNFRPSFPTSANMPPLGVSGVKNILIYVGTSAGAETLQATLTHPDFTAQGIGWTEATTGLVTGTVLPSSNTTHTLSKYGIFELTNGGGYSGPNVYCNNHFYGFTETQTIYSNSASNSRSVRYGNTNSDYSTGLSSIDNQRIASLSSVSGSVALTRGAAQFVQASLSGNTIFSIDDWYVKGDSFVLQLNQDSTGTRTVSFTGSNIKLSQTFTASTAANARDIISFFWDGTYWVENYRCLGTALVSDATSSSKGIVQLAGDFAGTATSPQVTATHLSSALPITQGGTGSTTQNFVDISTAQTVAGLKQFSNNVGIGAAASGSRQLRLYGSSDQGLLIESSGDHPRLDLKGTSGTSTILGSFSGSNVDIIPVSSTGINSGNYMRAQSDKLILDTVNADATTTLKQTPGIQMGAKYWDGTTSQYRAMTIMPVISDTTPTYRMAFTVASEQLTLHGNGNTGIGKSTPTSTLHSGGSLATAVTASPLTGATTLDATYEAVEINTTANIGLPALATCPGRVYEFVNINASAATVKANGSELIGNLTTANTASIASGGSLTLKAFPSAWRIV